MEVPVRKRIGRLMGRMVGASSRKQDQAAYGLREKAQTVSSWHRCFCKLPTQYLYARRDKQQDKVNQTNGLRLPRYRLLFFKDKSGFPPESRDEPFYIKG